MYVSDRDRHFFNNIQEELMDNFIQQELDYLTVENIANYDEDEDIYNETAKEDVIFANPVTLNAHIHTHQQEYTVQEFGGRYKNSITVMIHKNELEERELTISEGQYFRRDENLFQILREEGRADQIWGQPD